MDPIFRRWMANTLVALPERGIAYYPVSADDYPYDDHYFDKYRGYARTDLGRRLTNYRVALVNRFTDGDVVDIGIGCGAFIDARGHHHTRGYDINPAGVTWLRARGLWLDPYRQGPVESITCWDSLEHIAQPKRLLDQVRRFVFVSMPIFESVDHILRSKHYRRDEHYWYFTTEGLVDWMREHGFRCLETSRAETDLGREDIGTFVFARDRSA